MGFFPDRCQEQGIDIRFAQGIDTDGSSSASGAQEKQAIFARSLNQLGFTFGALCHYASIFEVDKGIFYRKYKT
jgi:hypothetical protein